MPPKKTTKAKSQPKETGTLRFEWFPVYGLRSPQFPWAYVTGKTPEEAMQRLAGFVSDQGRKDHKDYTIVFANEPFEID